MTDILLSTLLQDEIANQLGYLPAETITIVAPDGPFLFTDLLPPGYGPGLYMINSLGVLLQSTFVMQEAIDALENGPRITGFFSDLANGISPGSLTILGTTGAIWWQSSSGGGSSLENAADVASSFNITTKASGQQSLARRAMIIPRLGQSLAIFGGTYTPHLYTPTPVYPANIFMPDNNGIWTNGVNWINAVPAFEQYYSSNIAQGSDPTGATQGESGHVNYMNRVYEQFRDQLNILPIIGGFCEGAGGQSITDLGPGSDPWETALIDIQQFRDWFMSELKIGCFVPEVLWIHGNADVLTMSGQRYMTWLLELQMAMTDDCRRMLGQKEEVLFRIIQNTSAPTSPATFYEVNQAQIEICARYPNLFRSSNPEYFLYHPDSIHENSPNYYIGGGSMAVQRFNDQQAGGRAPFGPIVDDGPYWTGTTTFELPIAVPTAPIVIDTTSKCSSGTVTITNASPGFVNFPLHNQTDGSPVIFGGSIGLPTPLVAGTTYYVKTPTASGFNIAATPGGAAINTGASPAGVITASFMTLTIANPGVVNWVGNGLPEEFPISFFPITGSLPTVPAANTSYFVKNAGANSFNLSTTPGGAAIQFTGSPTDTIMAFAGYVSITGLDWGKPANSLGFEIDDFSGAPPYISAISIVDDGTSLLGRAVLGFTLSAAPASTKRVVLYYAARGQAATSPFPQQGPIGGGRGAVRDSDPSSSPIDRNGASNTFPTPNVMGRFQVTLPKP